MVSYSHQDEMHRQFLEKALAPLKRQGLIDLWSDHRIAPGADIDAEVQRKIESVDIVLLLISPDFINSDYCYQKELDYALKRHEASDCVVLPIILRACDWHPLPFGRLKAAPADGKPITTWSDLDEAWVGVAKAVRELVDGIKARASSDVTSTVRTARESVKEEFKRLHEFYSESRSSSSRFSSTGLAEFDEIWGPFVSSEFAVIAARPGMGHHDLVLGIALHSAIKRKVTVLYLAPRDSAMLVARRAMSSIGMVNRIDLANGDVSEEGWPRITNAIAILTNLPLLIDEARVLSCSSMISRLRGLCAEHHPELVVIEGVDYFVSSLGDGAQEGDALYISRQLKSLARDVGLPVIASLSIPPGPEVRADKRPRFVDLKHWHCLEEDADRLAFLYRDEYYYPESVDKGMAEIDVVKNSSGTTGMAKASYLQEFCRFESFFLS
jgi:replicative DNA helicase